MKRRKRLKPAGKLPAASLAKRMSSDRGHAAPPAPSAEARDKRMILLAAVVCGLLVLAVAIVFGRTVAFDFVDYDDLIYVSDNPELARGLGADGIAWALTTTRCTNWHPLTWLSLLADHELYGAKPWGYHLTNVLLHAATVVLLFLVLRRMTGDLWPSAFVAAVFAIHPLRVESVAWVAERKDVLSGLFFMLTLAAYLGYVRRPFSLVRYLAVLVLFALGLMAKPMLVTLPFVLLLLDYWPLGRMSLSATDNPNDRWGGSCTATPGAAVQLPPQQAVISIALAAGRREAAAFGPVGRFLRGNVAGPARSRCHDSTRYRWLRGPPMPWFRARPTSGNSSIRSAWPCSIPIRETVCRSEDRGRLAAPGGHHRGRSGLLAAVSLAAGRLVLVLGNARAGDRSGAGGCAVDGRPLHVFAPDRSGDCLGVGSNQALGSWPYRGWLYGVASALVVAILMGCAWRQASYWRDSETLWTHAIDLHRTQCGRP